MAMKLSDKIRKVIHLGYYLFLKDFRYRYRQTFFGYFWAVLKPLLIGVPLILIGRQFDLGSDSKDVPYEIYSFAGIILFQIFWEIVMFPQWIMRRSRQFFKNVRVPYESVIFAGLCYSIFNTLIYIAVLAVIFLVCSVHIPISAAVAVLLIPVILLCGLSIGIFFAPVTLIYLDIRYALPLISTLMLWSVPLVYKSPASGILYHINRFNPLTYLLTVPRELIFGHTDTSLLFFAGSICFFLAFLYIGLKFYFRAMPFAVDQIL